MILRRRPLRGLCSGFRTKSDKAEIAGFFDKFRMVSEVKPVPMRLHYSLNGYYFVTICSNNRENIFGEYIENPVGTALAAVRYKNNMKLSDLGNIIEKQWNDIPNRHENVEMDQYVIMPNHIHGILIIHKRTGATCPELVEGALSLRYLILLDLLNQKRLLNIYDILTIKN